MTECPQSGCVHSGLKQPAVCHGGCQSHTEMLPKVSPCKDDSGNSLRSPVHEAAKGMQGLCNRQTQ